MQGLSPKSAWTLFVVSIVLLGGLAFFANRSVVRYADSEGWVAHTREVEWRVSASNDFLAGREPIAQFLQSAGQHVAAHYRRPAKLLALQRHIYPILIVQM